MGRGGGHACHRTDLHSGVTQHSVGGGTTRRYPIRAIGAFCAANTLAQINPPAAPPSNPMNSRRLITFPGAQTCF